MFFVFISSVLFVSSALISRGTCFQGSNILPPHENTYSTSTLHSVRRHVFIKHDFHHLNVSRVGTFTVYDVFDCTFECLSNPLCFSVNLAATKGANGELWCEILSSDKDKNFTEFKENRTSHHFAIKSSCSSSPCQNEGTCLPNYKRGTFKCLCQNNFTGEYCEKVVLKSCKKAYDTYKSNTSQLVTLHFNSKQTSVLCHFGDFGCGDGGWTPVMKIDGNKSTFHYNAGYWNDAKEYNLPGGTTGFDTQETKLPSYWNTPFTKICLGMKIGQQINVIVINKQANSLYSLIADGQYRNTSMGRDTWKTLIGSQASMQTNCAREGFNAVCTGKDNKSRIGILGNDQNNCGSCDSRIGFGSGGHPDDSNTCGNEASFSPDNGDKHIKTMCYILVQ